MRNVRLVLAATATKHFATGSAMVFSLINGELDATVQTGGHAFIAPPMIDHSLAGLRGHSPTEHAAAFVSHVNGAVVFANG